MLEVQKYLLSGRTYEDLSAELGIKVARHDTLPLVILNYDQIESPKTHPIVRECRALVLRTDTHQIAARSFTRFFNWGEVQDEMGRFDFGNVRVRTKEDGSLCLIYNHEGRWLANTRGSFALDNMQHQDFTWQEGFCKALHVPTLQDLDRFLNPAYTYVCEFCSPWNKVVRSYPQPVMYLLTAFEGERELTFEEFDRLEDAFGIMPTPDLFEFKSIDEVQDFLKQQAEEDPTYEGVVMWDGTDRWKVKNQLTWRLHRLRGEGDNLFNPKNLLPFVLSGEEAELFCYFPEVKDAFYSCKEKVDAHFAKLHNVWSEHHGIPNQKDFALAIHGKTPFTGMLFQLRKQLGVQQTLKDLKKMWNDSPDQILKVIAKN